MASTNYQSQFMAINFMPAEDSLVGDKRIDYLNQLVAELERSLVRWYATPWTDEAKITTLAYQIYGNTTIWWMILNYNGYTDPLEIPAGALLRIPPITEINNYIQRTQTTINIGTKVVV